MKILTFFREFIRNIKVNYELLRHKKLWKNCPKNASFEEYMSYLKTLPEIYQWPLKGLDKLQETREKTRNEFPYVVTYKGGYNPGIHDDMEDWCREQFGDAHGECNWTECPYGYEYWYENSGMEALLDKNLEVCGERPDRDDTKEWEEWRECGDRIIGDHFAMVEDHPDAPGDHSHKGRWKTVWLRKTGYDYGYQDYCFKNAEDAMFFKIFWDEDASR
jgi:hypothetical protein